MAEVRTSALILVLLLAGCSIKAGSFEMTVWPGFNFEASLSPPGICFGCLETAPVEEDEDLVEPDVD